MDCKNYNSVTVNFYNMHVLENCCPLSILQYCKFCFFSACPATGVPIYANSATVAKRHKYI